MDLVPLVDLGIPLDHHIHQFWGRFFQLFPEAYLIRQATETEVVMEATELVMDYLVAVEQVVVEQVAVLLVCYPV